MRLNDKAFSFLEVPFSVLKISCWLLLGVAFSTFSSFSNSFFNASINRFYSMMCFFRDPLFRKNFLWIELHLSLQVIALMKSFIHFVCLDLLYFLGVGQKFKSLLSSLNSLYVLPFLIGWQCCSMGRINIHIFIR